eukprot:TRINITY_DN27706_c0_g1_i1.p1 TRINITY_DN27706_c0_g1~~TRINITY_DN27706_c0_g1_i1.p1  ORF type:complete len:555 (-),score=167.44 TRINITY_DN27706_c0_g1_i1:41-1582(-)
MNNKEYFPDVKLVLGKKNEFEVYAHKMVLVQFSSVFKDKLSETSEVPQTPKKVKSPKSPKGKGNKGKEIMESDDSSEKKAKKRKDSEEEYSHWEKSEYDTIYLPQTWSVDSFLSFLKFIYTGSLTIKSRDEAKEIGEIAFEYLLDPLIKFCLAETKYPAIYSSSDDERVFRFKKMVGRPLGSDVSFVFDKSRRLLAHKFLLASFSTNFRELFNKDPTIKYIEVPHSISEKALILYLRVIYTNYQSLKTMDKNEIPLIMEAALHFKDHKIFQVIDTEHIFNGENVLLIKKLLTGTSFEVIKDMADVYIKTHFDKLIRSSSAKTWPPSIVQKLSDVFSDEEAPWITSCSWLDVLWFAHYTENEKLKLKASGTLHNLINIENVLPILVAAHTTGEKSLRDKCIDFMIEHAPFVEEFQKMRAHADFDISRVGALSDSIRNTMNMKVKNRVTTLKTDLPKAKSKPSIFNKKKFTCSLCKRVVEEKELKKNVDLPELFGSSKGKQVCLSCESLITLVKF